MIFRPALLPKVLDGSKTQTRRKVDAPYRAGRVYAIQPGRGKPALPGVGLLVTSTRTEYLGEISAHDIWREGFPNRSAFLAYFARITEPGLTQRRLKKRLKTMRRRKVKVISFRLVTDA